MPKQYSQDIKQKIVMACQNGASITEVCQNYGIAPSTLYRWLKESVADDDINKSSSYQLLLHKKVRLEHMIEILHLSGIIDEVPLRKRLEILETLHNHH